MQLMNPKKLKEILNELVKCPSVSGTKMELDMAKKVYSIVAKIPYFSENPEYLNLNEIKGDKLNRCFVTALLKGKGSKTVVLLHHNDVVDVEDYGSLKDFAFDPNTITEKLKNSQIPKNAIKDLESGDWLFGRGVMDMKAGAALQIALINDYSETIKDLEGNILLLSVPSEESNSEGMIGAVPYLNELSDKYGLDYVAVVNSEPHDINPDNTHDIATGTIGKILPVFYCFGKETHATMPFTGLSSALIFSQVEELMENNIDLCDECDGEYGPPAANLKNNDLREVYNVTTPQTTVGYYNVLSMQRSPAEILNILKEVAGKAFENALNHYKNRAEKFSNLTGIKIPPPEWEVNVYTFDKLYNLAKEAEGEKFVKEYNAYIKEAKKKYLDEREFTIRLIDKVHDYCPDRSPKIVIAFAPPFYPHFRNLGKTPKEKNIIEVTDKLINYGKKELGINLTINKIFKGITDLSYCGLQDSEDITKHLAPNMPAINKVYNLPIEDLKKLDTAVINVGPIGRDAHKFTERLHLPFFENEAPKLLKYTVDALLTK